MILYTFPKSNWYAYYYFFILHNLLAVTVRIPTSEFGDIMK